MAISSRDRSNVGDVAPESLPKAALAIPFSPVPQSSVPEAKVVPFNLPSKSTALVSVVSTFSSILTHSSNATTWSDPIVEPLLINLIILSEPVSNPLISALIEFAAVLSVMIRPGKLVGI